jgi:hypothetical protein
MQMHFFSFVFLHPVRADLHSCQEAELDDYVQAKPHRDRNGLMLFL